MIAAGEPRTPVTVVTGPGLAGKTALLAHLTRDPALARSVVLTAGARGLVADSPKESDATIQLGCVCCTVQGDLQRSLRALLPKARRGDVSHVLVDADARSDPMAVLTTLITDPVLAAVYRIGGVVAVVDRAGLTRGGSAGPGDLRSAGERLRPGLVVDGADWTRHGPARPGHLHPMGHRLPLLSDSDATSSPTDRDGPVEPGHDGVVGIEGVVGAEGVVGVEGVLGAEGMGDAAHDPAAQRLILLADRVIALGGAAVAAVRGLNPAAVVLEGLPEVHFILQQDRFAPLPTSTDTVVAVTLPDPVDWAGLVHRLNASVLSRSPGGDVQRLFGVLQVEGESRPVTIDAVRHHLAPPSLLPAWPAGCMPHSRLIFGGDGLDCVSIRAALADLSV